MIKHSISVHQKLQKNILSLQQQTSVGSDNVNTITVNFGTNVVGGAFEGSATNLNAYTLNSKKLSDYAGAQVVLTAQNTAKITLPKGSVAKTDDAAVLQVSGVKSIDGLTNKLYTTVLATALTDNVAPNLQSAQLLADGKTFVLTYDENLKESLTGSVKTAFKFTEGGKDVTIYDAVISKVVGKSMFVTVQKSVITPAEGFYHDSDTAYTPVANDTIVKGGTTYTYYAKDAEIVAPVTNAVDFDTTKSVTIETVDATDKVEDVKGNNQKAEIKVTTTR